MLRSLPPILVALLFASTDPVQSQSPSPKDSTVKTDTVGAMIDSIYRRPTAKSERPGLIASIFVPDQRSGICGSIAPWRCAAYGAVILGGIGYAIGSAASAQPEYQHLGLLDGGDIFGGETCVKHCGVPHRAIIFAVSGSAIGGIAGWLVGKM